HWFGTEIGGEDGQRLRLSYCRVVLAARPRVDAFGVVAPGPESRVQSPEPRERMSRLTLGPGLRTSRSACRCRAGVGVVFEDKIDQLQIARLHGRLHQIERIGDFGFAVVANCKLERVG